jgi:probable HAF family extracellular repeat protein
MTDLGTLGGGNYSTATAINSAGQVAGYATDANDTAHAFVFTGSTMLNLDSVLPPGSAFTNLALAYGINDSGQISGGGFTTNGSYHAFLVTPPSLALTCSSNITATATNPAGATVFFSLTTTGGCSTPFIAATPPSGGTFPVGTNIVSVIANDACGHTNICSFTVTVKPPVTIVCSSNITTTATGPGGAIVNYTVSAIGGCNPPPSVVADPPSGSTFPVGTNVVTATASDACGNTNICSFTVTVNPPLSPVTIASPTTVTNNQFQMTIQGVAGQRFAILTSTNLINWNALVTNMLASTSTNFVDAAATTNNSLFYRAMTLP